MLTSEKVAAGAHFAQRVERQPALRQVHALRQGLHHRELVGIHDELLVAGDQAAFEPARRVSHEIDAGEQRRQQCMRALVGGLRIGDLRGAQRSAATARHAEAPRELRGREYHLGRLRRAEGRRTGAHRNRSDKGSENHRGAGPHDLGQRHAGQGLGEDLGEAAGGGHRPHRPGEHRRYNDRALVGARELAQCPEHSAVEHQRRIRVDISEHHGVRLEIFCAEQHAGKADGVARMAGRLGRRLAALIAVSEERILHVEVTFVRSNLHRLAHAAAGKVDRRRHVRELDEILQILERAVATPAIEVVDERRPANRREHGRVTPEAHVAHRIARIQREFPRRGLEQLPREAARDADALTRDVGAGPAPQTQGLRIAPKLDADLLEYRFGVGLDDLDRLGAEQLDDRQLAADIGILGGRRAGPRQPNIAAAGPRG